MNLHRAARRIAPRTEWRTETNGASRRMAHRDDWRTETARIAADVAVHLRRSMMSARSCRPPIDVRRTKCDRLADSTALSGAHAESPSRAKRRTRSETERLPLVTMAMAALLWRSAYASTENPPACPKHVCVFHQPKGCGSKRAWRPDPTPDGEPAPEHHVGARDFVESARLHARVALDGFGAVKHGDVRRPPGSPGRRRGPGFCAVAPPSGF